MFASKEEHWDDRHILRRGNVVFVCGSTLLDYICRVRPIASRFGFEAQKEIN